MIMLHLNLYELLRNSCRQLAVLIFALAGFFVLSARTLNLLPTGSGTGFWTVMSPCATSAWR